MRAWLKNIHLAILALFFSWPSTLFSASAGDLYSNDALYNQYKSTLQNLGGSGRTLRDLATNFIDLINLLIPLVIAIGVLGFLVKIAYNFFLRADSEEGKKAGKSTIVWGLIFLFVMLSVWGIVRILKETIFPGS